MQFSVKNPRSGIIDYHFTISSNQEVALIAQQCKAAQLNWCALSIAEKIVILQYWKQQVLLYKKELLDSLVNDTGRYWETVLEVDLIASNIDRWCSIAKEFFIPIAAKETTIPFIELQQNFVAYPLVGVVSPWNFPLLLSLIDTIPALLAGCSVIVKPSEITPRFITVMQKIIAATKKQYPSFCLQYIEGNGSVGEALIEHCDLICFTGSTTTGKKVYAAAAKKMIPVFLELGGKDPAVVLDGADIDKATSAILWGSTANAGQSCLSIERVYVQQPIYKNFVQKIVAKANALTLNATNLETGNIGPIIFEKQVQIINTHLQDAIAKGAVLECGSIICENINGGYYCKPTVLTNVNHTMKIMQEETFGPIIPIMAFQNVTDAITLANDTIYGLSGAVFAKTIEEAIIVANKIDGGAISINDAALTAIMHEGEKQSFKLSGIGGTRMGPNAMKRFLKQKVFITKTKDINSPWWY
jgi:acyl-CoA reductase-like NAD-dependent aldehyde dehydrogenase